VLEALQPHAGRGDAVDEAISYYQNHQHRMAYATYRARGLQIGSGTIESACKQLVSARLKLAGMIWNTAGAEAVAVVQPVALPPVVLPLVEIAILVLEQPGCGKARMCGMCREVLETPFLYLKSTIETRRITLPLFRMLNSGRCSR
jgi:hypothetical protein